MPAKFLKTTGISIEKSGSFIECIILSQQKAQKSGSYKEKECIASHVDIVDRTCKMVLFARNTYEELVFYKK